jgi:cytochrome c peroxidase
MKKNILDLTFATLILSAAALAGCNSKKPEPKKRQLTQVQQELKPTNVIESEASIKIASSSLIGFRPSLPLSFKKSEKTESAALVHLGRQLYYDKRLSKNHDVSCNSCHNLEAYGVDNKAVSSGHKKQLGGRNSPTVYNAAGHFVQFWDGRSPHVEHQATQPVLNPIEMAMKDPDSAARTLASIPGYVKSFATAFPEKNEPITLKNAGIAMGAFERGLVTPSRWDNFLAGEADAITSEEKQGFNVFQQTGCASCHGGTLVGGQMYQRVGTIEPWPSQEDQGRYEVTKKESDRMVFKVPSLRNVTKTAPYFHDGSEPKLENAIRLMAKHQLGRKLSSQKIQLIIKWLGTLQGKLPSEYIREPKLPASSSKTPSPDPS